MRTVPPHKHPIRTDTVNKRRSDAIPDTDWRCIADKLGFSPRELEVALCVINDLSESRTAQYLHISNGTVHAHLQRIYAKVGVHSRAALVALVFETYAHLSGSLHVRTLSK
jgi:DNA-binding CsgD family transcriptional regulator